MDRRQERDVGGRSLANGPSRVIETGLHFAEAFDGTGDSSLEREDFEVERQRCLRVRVREWGEVEGLGSKHLGPDERARDSVPDHLDGDTVLSRRDERSDVGHGPRSGRTALGE